MSINMYLSYGISHSVYLWCRKECRNVVIAANVTSTPKANTMPSACGQRGVVYTTLMEMIREIHSTIQIPSYARHPEKCFTKADVLVCIYIYIYTYIYLEKSEISTRISVVMCTSVQM